MSLYILIFFAGKKFRLVPSLLPLFLVDALNLIHSNRQAFNILEGNTFLFSLPNSLSPILPYPLIKIYCQEFGIENVKSMTSTRWRHQFTTTFQLVKSKDNQLKWIQVSIFMLAVGLR